MAKPATLWHGWRQRLLSASKASILIPLTLPVALAAGAYERITNKKAQRTAEDVATIIRNFLDGSGKDWDWDDFTSVPIGDVQLEAIRQQADKIALPLSDAGRVVLVELLGQAQRLSTKQ
jgi:hypothetical protein